MRWTRPSSPKGRFQGFSPDDVIYLLMPDRFANGDPSNDSPPEFGRPADRNAVGGATTAATSAAFATTWPI